MAIRAIHIPSKDNMASACTFQGYKRAWGTMGVGSRMGAPHQHFLNLIFKVFEASKTLKNHQKPAKTG